MATDKRERQKTARQAKIEAEQAAAKKARTKRSAIRIAAAAVVIVGGLFLYSTIWGSDDKDKTENADDDSSSVTTGTTLPAYSNPQLAEEVLARTPPETTAPPAETPPTALDISTLIEGQGEGAVAGDTVLVHYVGKNSAGTVFDESWSTGSPYPVESIGQAQVIQGWNEGLIGAKIGERRHLVIGAEKAYGAEERGPDIPPNSPLAFDVDVVDIIKVG